ncbi:MAG: hypothetical protein ACI8UP_004502 [Porticoccaceae bacterium]
MRLVLFEVRPQVLRSTRRGNAGPSARRNPRQIKPIELQVIKAAGRNKADEAGLLFAQMKEDSAAISTLATKLGVDIRAQQDAVLISLYGRAGLLMRNLLFLLIAAGSLKCCYA